jgi:hypothetical protein
MLGRWTQALLGVTAAVYVLAVVAGGWEYSLLTRIRDDISSVDIDEAEAADALYSLAGVLQLLAVLVTGIVFLIWMHRAYSNLRAFRAVGLRHTPGWAVGGWFVPFLNFVRPKRVMNEIWSASGPEWAVDTDRWRAYRPPALLSWWWGLFLGGGLLGTVVDGVLDDEFDIDDALAATSVEMVADAIHVAAALLAIIVVGQVVTRQRQRAAYHSDHRLRP